MLNPTLANPRVGDFVLLESQLMRYYKVQTVFQYSVLGSFAGQTVTQSGQFNLVKSFLNKILNRIPSFNVKLKQTAPHNNFK